MLTIFVVFQEEDGASSSVLSTHSTREGAERVVEQCREQDKMNGVFRYYSVQERQLEV